MAWLRNILKRFLHPVLTPISKRYLSTERIYRYDDLVIFVPKTVFHPSFYLSTPILLDYVKKQHLKGKSFLEVGAGSGAVSLLAAKKGAQVTSLEINPIAVEAIQRSAAHNGLELEVIESDLFQGLGSKRFDWVFINPPYYPKPATNFEEMAFYCGEEFEFFQRFFKDLKKVIKQESSVRMILSQDCDLLRIKEIALSNYWKMEVSERVRKLGEWNYIYALLPFNMDTDSH